MNKQRLIDIMFEMLEVLTSDKIAPDTRLLKLYTLVTDAMDVLGVLENKS